MHFIYIRFTNCNFSIVPTNIRSCGHKRKESEAKVSLEHSLTQQLQHIHQTSGVGVGEGGEKEKKLLQATSKSEQAEISTGSQFRTSRNKYCQSIQTFKPMLQKPHDVKVSSAICRDSNTQSLTQLNFNMLQVTTHRVNHCNK